MRIGVVTGLAAEAACLGRAGGGGGLAVRCTVARPGAPVATVEALVEEGCTALVSFGTAGGLAPELAAGTLVLAEAVAWPDRSRIAVDPSWHARLHAHLDGIVPLVIDAVAAVADPLLHAGAKAACHLATGAVAVDMESGEVARVAATAGVPFIVIRAIADPAERAIPPWVMATVTADGRTPVAPILARLARRPGDLGPLLILALDARAALRTLRRVAALAGPLLAFDR